MEKPKLQDILAEKTKRETTYNALRIDQEYALSVYEMEQKIDIVKPYSVLRTPRPRNLVDVPVDHLLADKPVVKVKPRNVAKKFQEEADLHEKFKQSWIMTWIHKIRKQMKFGILYGEFFYKILVNDEILRKMKEEPVKSDFKTIEEFEQEHLLWEVNIFDNFPLIVNIPCPTSCFPHPYEINGRPYDIYEIYERDCFEVESKWPGSVLGFSQKHYGEPVKWCEWWHSDWNAFFCDSNPVFGDGEKAIRQNAYGFVPYRRGDAGFGIEGDKFEPHRRVKSILFPSYDMIKFESRIISQLDTIMTKFTHPIPVKTGDWDSSQIDYSPGHEIELPEGKFWKKDFEIIPGTEPPQSIFSTLSLINNYFEQMQPGVVRGQAIGASAPAYANEAMIGQTRLKYGGLLMSLNETTARALGDGLRLIETIIRKPVSIHATGSTGNYIQTIRPEDINGYYLCEVDLESKDPTLTNQRKMLGLRMYEAETISLTQLLEDYYSMPNATELIAKMEAEKIVRTDPLMRTVYVKQTLQYLEMEEELEIIKEQEIKNQNQEVWQTKKNQQMGTNELQMQQYMSEGKNMSGQEFPGKGIPRLEKPGGITPLNTRGY